MKVIIAVCLAFLALAHAKSVKDVADCYHDVLRGCRVECVTHVAEDKREGLSACLVSEAEQVRGDTRTCLNGKGIESTQDCFAMPHHEHAKGLAAGLLKFSEPLRNALKESAKCFKDCLAGKAATILSCQEGCPAATDDQKTKFNECTQSAREAFPSTRLTTCLNTNFGISSD